MKSLCTNKMFLVLLAAVILLPVYPNSAYSAEGYHNLGKMYLIVPDAINIWDTSWKTGSTTRLFHYPSGLYNRSVVQGGRRWYFTIDSRVDELGNKYDYNWTISHDGNEDVFIETRRHSEPIIIVEGEDESRDMTGIDVDPDIDMDVKIELYFKNTGIGFNGLLRSYSWANQYHGDYIMFDNEVELTLDTDLEVDGPEWPEQEILFYTCDAQNFTPCSEGVHNVIKSPGQTTITHWRTSKWYESELMAAGKIPTRARDKLLVNFAYDADYLLAIQPLNLGGSGYPVFDDVGDPDKETGEFLSPQYVGMCILHADKSVDDATDDIAKPVHSGWQYQWENHNSGYWDGKEGFYEFLDWQRIRVEEFHEGATEPPTPMSTAWMFQSVGPYAMRIGDNFRFVYAVGAGMIDRSVCVSEGAKWYEKYINGDANMAMYDQQKNDLIAQGEDIMYEHLDRAYWNLAARNLDIPDPPPTPNITVTSGPGRNIIEWSYPSDEYFKDPDHGIDDVKEWRIYRKLGAYFEDDPQDGGQYLPYELVGTKSRDEFKFEDTNVTPGYHYHYCVRAFDDGSLNDGLFAGTPLGSSYYNNRTKKEVVPYKPGFDTSNEVMIVPNPYSYGTGSTNQMLFSGYRNEIQFTNLPAYCTLKIYTATGDLIKTMEHTSGSDNERWEELRTDSNQRPVSGVYILAVDNARDLENHQLPKRFFKFVIVR